MSHKHRHHSTSMAMNDLLFNVLLGFVVLFIIAFLLINPPTKKADIPAKAEFLIMLQWDDESLDDIDVWVQFEDTEPVGYQHKEEGPVHLERDDRGQRNDMYRVGSEYFPIRVNKELVIIRGIQPGNYYVGLHGYHVRGSNDIVLQVLDINPYNVEFLRRFTIDDQDQKIAALGFTVDDEGKITDIFSHRRPLGPKRRQ